MKTSNSFVSSYNRFFLFFSIVWVPLQRYYLHVDGAGRSIMALSFLAIVLNILASWKKRNIFRSAAFVCWTLLVVFSFVNSMFKGFSYANGFVLYVRHNFLDSFVFLIVALIELDNDKFRCLKVVLWAQLVYLVLGGMHITVDLSTRSSSDVLGNMLPLTASCCAFVASYLFCNHQLRGGRLFYGAIIALVLVIIILSATRKAFGAVVFVIMGMVLGRSEKNSVKTFILLIVFVIVGYWGIGFVLDNTIMGERIAASSEIEVPLSSNPVVNGFLMTLLGDRAIQYYMVFEMFSENPLTGIGLNNFIPVTRSVIRLHTEYMVQLCENGLVGLMLLLVFYSILFAGLNRKRRKGKNIMMPLFGLLMVMFLDLTAWTYNMQMIMIVYAVLITEIYSNNNIYENSDTSSQGQVQ